jgi:transcriptional regulator with XRE-family HTH domain
MSVKKILTELTHEEIADAYVLPVSLNNEEQKSSNHELTLARTKRRNEMSDGKKLYNSLLLLKARLEDYVNNSTYKPDFTFGYFLQEYLQLQNKKQNEFAKEINVNSTVLNQYIHEHRVPNENIFVRFEIHSGELIKAVDLLRLVDKEKEYQISHDLDLRKREAQHVSKRLEFAF